MKKIINEQQIREQAIVENFAKTFNKIKRLDEQEVSEINLGKSIATLGLMAALTGSPEKATAQNDTTITQTTQKNTDIAAKSNLEAGKTLIDSYNKSAFSANVWGKKSKQNNKFFNDVKILADKKFAKLLKKPEITDKDIEMLGAKYKNTKIAKSFLNRTSVTFNKSDKPNYE